MELTAWTLVADLGLMCLLLLIGQVLRAKISLLQTLFLPASIIAGMLGLALGPNGLDIIPFSDLLSEYPSVLIVLLMTSVPIGQTIQFRRAGNRVGALYSYSQAGQLLQWGLGLMLALALLGPLFNLHDGFGLLLGAGWAGGFGTAAAVGSSFEELGWAEATSLGFTSATVGVLVCIVGGLIITKWAARTGKAENLAKFDELPPEMRTGLIPPEQRVPLGHATLSSSSLESLTLHIGLILLGGTAAYYIGQFQQQLFPSLTVPVLAIGFLIGLALQILLMVTRTAKYVDRETMTSVTGTLSDLLVAFGISSIVPSVVVDYAVPLAALLVFGLVFCVVLLRYLTPRMFREQWFERGIFTWGWLTASVATGVALLRIVDPRLKSKTLEDFGMAYVGIAPVEIILISTAPVLTNSGYGWALVAATLGFGVVTLIIARMVGWWSVAPPETEGEGTEADQEMAVP